jgi:hypothetical protein
MSLHDYRASKRISAADPPFAALIMAALRKADTWNARAIEAQWPTIADELRARYNAPGGVLPTDPQEATR